MSHQGPPDLHTFDGVLGGVVEQPGDLATVLRHHADGTQRSHTRTAAPAKLNPNRHLGCHVIMVVAAELGEGPCGGRPGVAEP
jgi:hypothetical protein